MVKKKPAQSPEDDSKWPRQTSVFLFKEDDAMLVKAIREGLDHGVRISQSNAIRLLMRHADLDSLTKEEFEKIAEEDRRRRSNKPKSKRD